jgi:hypothetical protein
MLFGCFPLKGLSLKFISREKKEVNLKRQEVNMVTSAAPAQKADVSLTGFILSKAIFLF